MKLSKYEIFVGAVAGIVTYIFVDSFSKKSKKRLMKATTITGGYQVPENIPNRADALHAFQSRKSDGFGGKMSTIINNKLRELYKQGINPDITNLKINVDSKNYKVDWEATIEPSKDGKAYVGISTVGSTGSGADTRAQNQIEKMKTWNENARDYTLLLDFKNEKGNYIRQFFYKWTNPTDFPAHT
jgi:hypothetical protein